MHGGCKRYEFFFFIFGFYQSLINFRKEYLNIETHQNTYIKKILNMIHQTGDKCFCYNKATIFR